MVGRLFYEKWIFRFIDLVRCFDVLVRIVSPVGVICCLSALSVIGFPQSASAQRNLTTKDAPEPEDDLARLPSDRKISQQLQELTRLARGGNVTNIRDLLQLLRAADPSLMVPDGRKTFHPLHRDLLERIQTFPPELQTEILKDASVANPLLRTAFESEGPGAVVRFLHRHSGSTESYKAHLLLAAIHRDRGHRQATLYWLSPVLHSAAPADLRRIAVAMQKELNTGVIPQTDAEADTRSDADENPDREQADDSATDPPDAEIPVAESGKPKPDGAEQSADVARKAATGDSISLNSDESTAEPFPLSQSWQQALHLNSMQRRATSELVRLLAADVDHPATAWMAGEPVVDTQAVYVRSSGGLLAYDRPTGRVLWTRLFDRQTDVRRTIDTRRGFPDANDRSPLDARNLQNLPVILELHRDEITTRMTSDASRLFAICDTGESAATSLDFSRLQRRGDLISSSMRELVAIEKSTGRRLWSAGGAQLEAQFANELSRAWFAGPPTISGDMLFGLVEMDDAHWLVCLRCETGEVLWKLMLAYPETDVFQDSSRQLYASRPLVADGLIWTGTNDGWLVATDALTRSVVWSRSMIQKESGMFRGRNLRGGPLQMQPPTPFPECWRPEEMHLMQNSLLVTGPEGHQLLMINPITGSVRRRISAESATVILSVDDESIVLAGPKKIQRLRRDNFDVVWATQLTTADIAPTGPGTRLNNHLLVPLSDGSIRIVRYSDGQLTDTLPGLRPEFSAGGLINIAGDVVSYGPDHVALLSQSATAVPHEPDLIEQARILIAAGRFADAEETLAGFTPSSGETDAARRLLFRISTALTLNDAAHSKDHLRNATRYAMTTQEEAVVLFLKCETQSEMSADLIVEFLKAEPAVLNTELPDREELRAQLVSPVPDIPSGQSKSDSDAVSSVTRPIRHVLLQAFEQHLAETDSTASASWIAALKNISDDDILSIGLYTAAVRDELLRRADDAIRAGRLTESTLHLLLQARHCENQIRVTEPDQTASDTTAGIFEQQFAELVSQFKTRLAADAVRMDLPLRPHPAALNLLAVVQAELLPTSATTESPDPQQGLAEQWSAWKDHSYTVVPVNPVVATTSSQRNEQTLLPRYREDPFLSAWRWSTFLDPAILAVRSLLLPTEPLCTIDGGMFDPLSSGNDGTVIRFGSVLLVQNTTGLTAVSVIDQRVLWSRRIPNRSSEVISRTMSDMGLFNNFSTSLQAWQEVFAHNLRICGGNDRWICVQSPTRVEMIDLLTGQNLWSRQSSAGDHDVFATESCVFLNNLPSELAGGDPESVTCLNRVDGTTRESAFSPSQLQQTILATGDELVVWESNSPDTGATGLTWMNSATGEVRHRLPLTNMLNCQFMDARTLVSVTKSATFEVIDLLTTEKHVVRFAANANNDATTENGTTPDYLVKVMIVADPINYYVLPIPDRRASQAQNMLRSTGEHNLYPVEKEIRAIDRATGKLRWVRDTDENTAVLFEPTADPVLLLLNSSVRKTKANAPPALAIPGLVMRDVYRTTVIALSRNSGTKLFEYSVSSRFPGPGLEFKVTPQQYLDLQAFGNRVRFIPEAAPTAVPRGSE